LQPRTSPAAPRAPIAVGAVRRNFAPWADPALQPLIRFEGVKKRFGAAVAVDGIDLSIFEREFFCLLGPSGCGKTTLMRMLGGFEEPDDGRVMLGGENLAGVPPYRRPVNMMFQSYALFPHLSVEDNIAFGLKQEGLPKSEIADRVTGILGKVQLLAMAGRRPDQLSGGQRQRVALARALVKRPKVLLLDEPLGALDKRLREETQYELMDLQVELGITFLMVTHDQDEAMSMADRIAIMDRGRIIQIGTPADIYESPASRRVAEFLGDVTIFEGEVTGRGDFGWTIESRTAGTTLIVGTNADLALGQSVGVAIRPEKLRFLGEGEEGANILSGEVWDIGYLGDWTVYRIRLASGLIVRVSRANTARIVDRPIGWEDRVRIAFDPSAAVVLTT
jgi:putrescine transport system ATP-binding protein